MRGRTNAAHFVRDVVLLVAIGAIGTVALSRAQDPLRAVESLGVVSLEGVPCISWTPDRLARGSPSSAIAGRAA